MDKVVHRTEKLKIHNHENASGFSQENAARWKLNKVEN